MSKIIRRWLVIVFTIFITALALVEIASPALAIQQEAAQKKASSEKVVEYACPMHQEVTSSKRGRCPKCGMDLVDKSSAPETKAAQDGNAVGKNKATGEEKTAEDQNKSMAKASAAYFPNLTLQTQDNQPVRFYDDLLKGKTVLINFLFTTCKGVCPPMTANLARVQKLLGERVGRDILMISISVDPLTDTPGVLKKFADNFKAQPGWYFLTGEKKNVDLVLYKLGGYVENKDQHTSVLIIGNEATGEWMKVMAMSKPEEIANAALKLASQRE